jgi:hypothetical protein
MLGRGLLLPPPGGGGGGGMEEEEDGEALEAAAELGDHIPA